MRKTAAICLILLSLLGLFGCGDRLTLETLRGMAAEKGEALTWSDFERYPGTETGSGLYILVYALDADYRLMIGGMPDEAPLYIYLVSVDDDSHRIDIRYEDIDAFLKRDGRNDPQ